MYQILVIDYDDAAYGEVYSDGEIIVKWKAHSEVPHKHHKGGQSAARFQRIRDNEITHWFKRINEYLKTVDGEITVGMSEIYYKRFFKTLNTYNQAKIKERYSIEYSGTTGIYQLVKKIENKKK